MSNLSKMSLLLVFLMGGSAFARQRQLVTCEEITRSKNKVTMRLDFDPDVSLETAWKKDPKLGDVIITHKLGKVDGKGTTTAKVSMDVRPSWKKYSDLHGVFKMTAFYEVNVLGTQGYEEQLGPYRAFHGHDADDKWDAMFYFSDTASKKNAKEFKGILSVQPYIIDQGYYFYDMTCTSRVRNQN